MFGTNQDPWPQFHVIVSEFQTLSQQNSNFIFQIEQVSMLGQLPGLDRSPIEQGQLT